MLPCRPSRPRLRLTLPGAARLRCRGKVHCAMESLLPQVLAN